MSDVSPVKSIEYVLGQGRFASTRLNLQFELFIAHFGSQLFQNPLEPGLPNLKIADVCAGTGRWLARITPLIHSTSEIHAFDLNLSTLPPTSFMPSLPETARHKYNIFETPPLEHQSKYDIVNVSLTSTFTSDEKFPIIFNNILSLVKPGGHLQWFEMDVDAVRIVTPDGINIDGSDPSRNTTNHDMLRCFPQMIGKTWKIFYSAIPTWITMLESDLRSHKVGQTASSSDPKHPAYELMTVHEVELNPQTMASVPAFTEIFFMGFEEIYAALLKRVQSDSTNEELLKKEQEYRLLLDGSWKEHLELQAGMFVKGIRVVIQRTG